MRVIVRSNYDHFFLLCDATSARYFFRFCLAALAIKVIKKMLSILQISDTSKFFLRIGIDFD